MKVSKVGARIESFWGIWGRGKKVLTSSDDVGIFDRVEESTDTLYFHAYDCMESKSNVLLLSSGSHLDTKSIDIRSADSRSTSVPHIL
jgi:hypothetical protein